MVIRTFVVSQTNYSFFLGGGGGMKSSNWPRESIKDWMTASALGLNYSSLFTLTQSLLNLRNLALSLLRACWGHFCPKFGGWGAQKHFIGGVNSMFKIKIQISCGHFDIKLTY